MPSRTTISGTARAPRTRSSIECAALLSTSATTPWCTPPRAGRLIRFAGTRSTPHAAIRGQRQQVPHPLATPVSHAHGPHASGAQRFEDRVDAVDDHECRADNFQVYPVKGVEIE